MADELQAAMPVPVKLECFNRNCELPYSLTAEHVQKAMEDFLELLGFVNQKLVEGGFLPLESFLMPATFSSLVGDFIIRRISHHCSSLVKNQYHNGHPDLLPRGMFPEDAAQHASEGIEIKASRRASAWQGHNPEKVWLIVFHFDSSTPSDRQPRRFCFKGVYAAQLDKQDWAFSGRSGTSRRTITATVNKNGMQKLKSNWVYLDEG